MTASSLKGIEDLIFLKREWHKRKELEQTELNRAIEQTQDVRLWLDRVSQVLTSYEKSISTVQEDNNRIRQNLMAVEVTSREPTDFLAFLDEIGISGEDTITILKTKFDQSFVDSKNRYDIAQAERYWNFYVLPHQKTVKISVSLSDEKRCLLEGLFSNNSSTESITNRDSFLMGHFAHSIYKKETREKVVGEPLIANESGIWRKSIFKNRKRRTKLMPTVSDDGFVMGRSKFVIVLENDDWISEEVHVLSPPSSPYWKFIQELGNWCFRQQGYQPTVYSRPIMQVCTL